MAFSPIVYPPQFHVAGEPASGYYLKAYKANTATAIQLATDRTGGTLVNKIQLNSEGYPEVSNNIIIPHVDQENKLALYPTETAADTDDTDSAIWIPDKIDVGSLPASYVDSVDTLIDLRNYSGESRTILLEGGSASADGDGGLYAYSSGQSAGTYTDDGESTIVPPGGDGSAAYLLIGHKKISADTVEINGIPFTQYHQVKVKTALSGVTNSSTLTNDGELIGYSLPEGKYSVEARLIVRSNAASNDMKFKFNPSSGSITGGAAIYTFMENAQASSQINSFNIEAEVSLTVSTSVSYLHLYGDIEIPSGGATIDFQFAQNTQESGTAIVDEGSSITFSRALN